METNQQASCQIAILWKAPTALVTSLQSLHMNPGGRVRCSKPSYEDGYVGAWYLSSGHDRYRELCRNSNSQVGAGDGQDRDKYSVDVLRSGAGKAWRPYTLAPGLRPRTS